MTNKKLLELVGTLKYPSFRTGLPSCLEQERIAQPRRLKDLLRGPSDALTRAWQAMGVLWPRCTVVPRVALIDNGSLKPEATLSLRRLAAALEAKAKERGQPMKVDAVSARFADRIPARDIDGIPAEILPGWLKRIAEEERGTKRKVVLLPLLIGPSDTVTKSIPGAARAVPQLDVEVAPSLVCLCPALYSSDASGAGAIAGMLLDRLAALCSEDPGDHIFVCDHGSPVARVAAAREAVRAELEKRVGRPVAACCMERREGPEYDFNGALLEDALLSLPQGARARVGLLFLQDGRHAGPGGDIATIIKGVETKRADLAIATTQVLAGHPDLVELLLLRSQKAVPVRLFH